MENNKMSRPISMKTVNSNEIPGPNEIDIVLLGHVKGTGRIPSVGSEHMGKNVYVIVEKVKE